MYIRIEKKAILKQRSTGSNKKLLQVNLKTVEKLTKFNGWKTNESYRMLIYEIIYSGILYQWNMFL